MNKEIEKIFGLKGKVAIVIGGAGLLGSTYVEVLSDAGANTIIADINQKTCDTLAKKITERNGINAIGIETDITNKNSVESLKKHVMDKFGKIDILINNAVSRPPPSTVEDYDLVKWKEAMSVNVDGVFLCCQIFGKVMVKQGSGIIVNIGSTYGVVSTDHRMYESPDKASPPVYATSKAGIVQLTKYLATYWAKKGIRVNCLSPGGVLNKQDPNFIKKYSDRVPLGRMANKDEYKGALLFMVSEASSYLTGANIIVDGGWTAW